MADWIDDIVSTTKQRYEADRVKSAEFLQRQERKKALGASFFGDLKRLLQENSTRFNKKFEGEVFSVDGDGPRNIITVHSRPAPNHSSTVKLSYAPEAHLIEISRGPGGPENYRLDLTPDGSRIIALYGPSTDTANGLSAELLSQNVMRSMLVTS